MTAIDRIADLSELWRQATMVFPYFDRHHVNWDDAYRDYLPRVMAAEDEREFHLLLAEFMNLLGDGHTEYFPPLSLRNTVGWLPFTLLYVQGGYCLHSLPPEAQQHRFARVISVNGMPFEDILREAFRYIYQVDGCAYPSKLHMILSFLLKPTGNRMETSAGTYCFDLLPQRPEPDMEPPPQATMTYRRLAQQKLDFRLFDNAVLYAKLDNFMYAGAADEIAQILKSCENLRGVILDLRENEGGMTAYGAKVAQLFLPGEFGACSKRTQTVSAIELSSASQLVGISAEQLEQYRKNGMLADGEPERSRKIAAHEHYKEYEDTYGAPDHRALFDGKMVILTSRYTISAAEDFVAMFRTNRRAVIIGAPTHGTTGTPMMLSLSCGGRARICSVGYRLSDGTEFVGRGIEPDIHAELSADDYCHGTDSVLDLALNEF